MGGDDFDKKIIQWIATEFKKQEGIDLFKDTLALQRLKEAAERVKHELSGTVESEINIPFVSSDSSGPKHLLLKLKRAELEKLVGDYIEKSIEITKKVVQESGFKLSDIHEVILVGGQTRMPKIIEEVKKLFGKEPNRTINADEVVAAGAAVQAGIMQGDVKDILLLDVTPLSLGIETMGGVFTKIIEKNTTVPTKKSQTFSTASDNQTSVEIHVLQGERELAEGNKTLARFILDGIPPSPRGMPQVEVSFDIDANGVLSVSAKDKASNREQTVRIEGSASLSKEDIERMKQDAMKHHEEDKKKKDLVELKNTADTMMYTVEKALRDAGDKVPADVKKSIEEKIEAVKKVKDSDSAEEIKKATEALSLEMQKIGEAMYKGGAGGANGHGDDTNSSSSAKASEGAVKDAEYKDVKKDENKKKE